MCLREIFLNWIIVNMSMLQSCSLRCLLDLRFSKPLNNLWANCQDFVALTQYSNEMEISICVKELGDSWKMQGPTFSLCVVTKNTGQKKHIASPCSTKQDLSGLNLSQDYHYSTWKIYKIFFNIMLTRDLMLITMKLQSKRYSIPKMLVVTENLCLQPLGPCCYLIISIV